MDATTPATGPIAVRSRAGHVPTVGRERELAQLRSAVEAVIAGEPRVVLLVGEAGIGKSRLLDETTRLMADRGGFVAVGRCLDERGMPPFLPWLGVVAELSRGAGFSAPSPAMLGFPDPLSAGAATDQASPSVSAEQRRLRLLESVLRAVVTVARERPLLLAFDDLQWSDASSNQLLRFVATNLPPVPVLIAGTYRAEERETNPELVRTVDELDRRRLATLVQVGPLPAAATAALLAGLVGEIDPGLAAAIHQRGEGNPFFLEEVASSLAEEGRLSIADVTSLPLPRGVVAVIQRRLAVVDDETRALLEIAAVAGREIDVETIAADLARDGESIAARLDDAVRAGLVRPAAMNDSPFAPDFEFLHDRIREAIVAGINPVRRRALHGRLAVVLESRLGHADDLARLAALTHHYQHARLFDRAALYAERLGDTAMRAHAHAEAVRAYRLAIAFTANRPPAGQADLLLRLGDALLAAGEDATETYASAERTFRAAADLGGAARALRRRGSAHARREEHEAAIACLHGARRTWHDLGETDAESVTTLVEIGSILGTSLARYEDAIATGRAALEAATRLGNVPALEADARLALAKSLMRSGDLSGGLAQLRPSLALALQSGNKDLAAEVAGALANHAYWTGDLLASERFARQRRDLATRAGDPYALRHARPWLAILALSRGEWDAATALIAEAEEDVRRVDSPEPRAFLGQLAGYVAFSRGRYSEAVALLEAAMAGFRKSGPATLAWYLGCLAVAYLAVGDFASARRVAAETAETIAALPARSLPRGASIAQLAIVAVRTGDHAAARRWYAELRPYAGQHHWVLMDRVLGMLAALLGDLTAAERYFAAAEAMAIRGGCRPEQALTVAARAVLRHQTATAQTCADVERELQEAVSRLRALEMTGEADRIAALLDTSTAKPQHYPAGLSEREVAVLTLLALGLTNREIGDRLGIAEKTVTNHLTHIFTKAGLDNRAAAVAFAIRHGLAS